MNTAGLLKASEFFSCTKIQDHDDNDDNDDDDDNRCGGDHIL